MSDWSERPAREIMSSPIVTVPRDATLQEAAAILSERGIGGAMVVDAGGEPVGVVSLFDIVSFLAGIDRPADEPAGFYREWQANWGDLDDVDAIRKTRVTEILSPELIRVDAMTPLRDVARLMCDRRIHRVFVEREGVISASDLLDCMAKHERVEP